MYGYFNWVLHKMEWQRRLQNKLLFTRKDWKITQIIHFHHVRCCLAVQLIRS